MLDALVATVPCYCRYPSMFSLSVRDNGVAGRAVCVFMQRGLSEGRLSVRSSIVT
jgi:hypothetical protein